MNMRNLMTGIFCGLAFCAMAADTTPLAVPRITEAPKLDGNLAEECWKNAAVLKDFTIIAKTNTTDATECRLMMDNAWLYLGFRCANPNMTQVDQKEKERDGNVSVDDSVEIFLDPGTAGNLCYQFMLSFANVQADRRFSQGGKRDMAWTIPWRSATQWDKNGWTAEMALPLSLIKNNGNPAKARMNVARNARFLELDAYGATLNETRVSSSWGAVSKSYQEQDGFRSLSGFDGLQIEEVFLASLESAEVGEYVTTDAGRSYTVKARVRSHTGREGSVKLQVADQPVGGEAGEMVESGFKVGPTQDVEISVMVPVRKFVRRNVGVALKDGTGVLLRELTLVEPAMLNLMGEVLTERNYYTTESEARLRLRLGLPAEELTNLTIVARLPDGLELARLAGPRNNLMLNVPLNNVPVGKHKLMVFLEDAKGSKIVEGAAGLTRLAPKPGCEVKVDRFRRVLLKNGEPVFPFGLVVGKPSAEDFKEAAAAGHTATWRNTKTESVTQFMAMAQSHGLDVVDCAANRELREWVGAKDSKLMQALNGYYLPKDAAEERALMGLLEEALTPALRKLVEHIRSIQNYPNLLFHHNVDEINLGNFKAKQAVAKAAYEVIHREDGYHPVSTVFSAHVTEGGLDVADIVAYDIYMKAGAAFFGIREYPNAQTYYLLKLKQQTDSANKVTMMMPVTEGQEPLRCPRLVLPEEQRCQTYLAVIHGAKGLFYFGDTFIYTQAMWDTLADLARQVRTLAPAILSGEVYSVARYTPVEMDIEKEVFPDVQATLFKNPAGGYILLAANSAYHPVDVKFTVPSLDAGAGVKQIFTDKKIKAENEAFQDAFEPLGTRAYALELKPDAVKPVALALEMTSHPDQALKLNRYDPMVDFKGRRNIAVNPSFEITSPPHLLPDYVRPAKLPPVPRVDMPGSPLVLDTEKPVHGKYSLRETIVLPCVGGRRGITGATYIPAVAKPTPIVVSFYVKASENVKQAYFSMRGINFEKSVKNRPNLVYFTPTADWQRISLRGVYDPALVKYKTSALQGIGYDIGPGHWNGFNPWRDINNRHARLNVPYTREFSEKATGTAEFWVDAVQVEFGEQATEFTTK